MKELHFFPKAHTLLWFVDDKVAAQAEAWGGEPPDRHVHYGVMRPHRTTPGRYVIHSYGPYRTETWPWSKIRWGTKLSLSVGGDHVLFETGLTRHPWRKIETVIPGLTKVAVQRAYYLLYGESHLYDPDGDYVPDIWVFNDFGPMAVRYFKDENNNQQLDKGEKLSGEMIHTTARSEAQAAKGNPVTLESSHGCIHVSPGDRDQLRTLGAFDKGTMLVVHPYEELIPPAFR